MSTAINCPACGNSVSGNVCTHCGWIRIVFPAEVPEVLKSFNSEYTKTLQAINKTNSDELKRMKDLRDSLKKELNEEKQKVAQFEGTIQNLRNSLEGTAKDTEGARTKLSIKDAIGAVKSKIIFFISENKKLQAQLDAGKVALDKEKKAHAQAIKRAEQLQQELEKVKAARQSANTNGSQPPRATTNRVPKGSVILYTGGRQHTFTIFSGDNSFLAPNDVGVSGEMFRIVETNGSYQIFDVCGLLKKANGKSVKSHGEEITNGLIFTINNSRIELDLPEINLDDIL